MNISLGVRRGRTPAKRTEAILKLLNFIRRIIGYFLRGKFALGLYTVARELPDWLVGYNKATVMYTNSFKFPADLNPVVKVRMAAAADIDDIVRISGVSEENVLYLLHSGAVCFLASVRDDPPAAVSWSASGHCYVRGMGFEYDYGKDGYYSFWSFTLPNARGKDLYLSLQTEKVKYELAKDAKKLYGLVEFTNEYSYSLRERLGYRPILKVNYLKILFVRFCSVRNVSTGKLSLTCFVREPKDDLIVI